MYEFVLGVVSALLDLLRGRLPRDPLGFAVFSMIVLVIGAVLVMFLHQIILFLNEALANWLDTKFL